MDKNLIEEMDILFSKFVSLTKTHGGHLINLCSESKIKSGERSLRWTVCSNSQKVKTQNIQSDIRYISCTRHNSDALKSPLKV